MKKIIRTLGIGIFLSGAFVFVYGQNETSQADSSSKLKPGYELVSKKELEDLRSELKSAKDELSSLQLSLSKAESDQPDESSPTTEKSGEGNFLLSIESGANPVTISQDLKNAGMISNERDFINYLEDHDLSSKIQVGQYTIQSGMTLSEIAKVITR